MIWPASERCVPSTYRCVRVASADTRYAYCSIGFGGGGVVVLAQVTPPIFLVKPGKLHALDEIGAVMPNANGFCSTAAMTEAVFAVMNLTPARVRSANVALMTVLP